MIKHDCHCGPGWFPNWIKRFLSKEFNGACAYHDDEYSKQEICKVEIDDKFLDAMIQMSGNRRKLFRAFSFYFFVRMFGWISWYKNKIRNLYKGD